MVTVNIKIALTLDKPQPPSHVPSPYMHLAKGGPKQHTTDPYKIILRGPYGFRVFFI